MADRSEIVPLWLRILQFPPVRLVLLGFALFMCMGLGNTFLNQYEASPIMAIVAVAGMIALAMWVYVGFARFIERREPSEPGQRHANLERRRRLSVRLTMLGLLVSVAAQGAAVAASAQDAPIPPLVEQQTADCTTPVFATDHLVCSDPALHALDTELAERLTEAPAPASRWIEPQRQWFLRRSRCAFAEDHPACATAAYRERLTLLRPRDSAAQVLKVKCSDPEIWAVSIVDDQIILMNREGNIAGTAGINGTEKSSWRPFLAAERRGRRVSIRTVDDAFLECRTTSR